LSSTKFNEFTARKIGQEITGAYSGIKPTARDRRIPVYKARARTTLRAVCQVYKGKFISEISGSKKYGKLVPKIFKFSV